MIVAVMALIGCTTSQSVRRPGRSASPYAPLNEKTATGVVRYATHYTAELTQKNHEDAYRQMYEACGGPYVIVREWGETQHNPYTVAQPLGGSAIVSGGDIPVEYTNIEYRCGG